MQEYRLPVRNGSHVEGLTRKGHHSVMRAADVELETPRAIVVTDAPILLVCTARPELYEQRSGWGARMRNATVANLAPLPP